MKQPEYSNLKIQLKSKKNNYIKIITILMDIHTEQSVLLCLSEILKEAVFANCSKLLKAN